MSESSPEPNQDTLDALRAQIDEADRQLVELLNRRASIVQRVGQVKQREGVPIYAPHREAAVLKKALAHNKGPLPDRAIEGIYRELMSGSFAIEQPLRIGYLGPRGSFSHVAAQAHFGSSVTFEAVTDIMSVFDEVRRGHVDYGLAPIENSTGGGITETLDAFRDSRGEVFVYAEALITIRHNLLSNCPPEAIRRIYSKPEIFTQCRKWLSSTYPLADLIPAASSSKAAETAFAEHAQHPDSGPAAIGSALAGQVYGLNTLYEDIEDNPNNITRFLVISKQKAEPSGQDKTSIMFTTDHTPGSLVRVLSVFDRAGINLSHIEKRPSGQQNWKYSFFIDTEGHRDDPLMRMAIEQASRDCQEISVLGSYPKATRIL
ncbi:MAG: prephenate dehydratase [Phycisphaeraceae bacterium]|nr:prephenate dehydratase [Phycisphaeraceae bacterium]